MFFQSLIKRRKVTFSLNHYKTEHAEKQTKMIKAIIETNDAIESEARAQIQMSARGPVILNFKFVLQSWFLFPGSVFIMSPQADSSPERRHSSVTPCVEAAWSQQRVLIESV